MNKNQETLHEPVFLKGQNDGIEVEIAFQYTTEFHENILGYCNNIYNAEGGTHITGFKTTFTTVMNQVCKGNWNIKRERQQFYRSRYP